MKYHVQINAEYYKDYLIEADSSKEAEQLAIDQFDYEESSGWDSIDVKVEEH